MASSSYYKSKIKEYEGIRAKIQGLLSYFDGCVDTVSASSLNLENVIINGKTFDDGQLEKVASSLSGIKANLQSIISECDQKIAQNENLYIKAYNAEVNAAKNKNNNTTSSSKSSSSTKNNTSNSTSSSKKNSSFREDRLM